MNQKLLKQLEAEKIKLEKTLVCIKKLITVSSEKINKRKEIYNACQSRKGNFIADDIKTDLMQSGDDGAKDISILHISAELCCFVKTGKIYIAKKGSGRNNPNIYSNKPPAL